MDTIQQINIERCFRFIYMVQAARCLQHVEHLMDTARPNWYHRIGPLDLERICGK